MRKQGKSKLSRKPRLGPCVSCGGMVPEVSESYKGHKRNCELVEEWKREEQKEKELDILIKVWYPNNRRTRNR